PGVGNQVRGKRNQGWGLRASSPFFVIVGLMLALPLLAVLVQALGGATVDALQAPAGTRAVVFIFTSTDCPISNRYAPEVRRLVERFGGQGVVFRLVYPAAADSDTAIRAHLSAFDYAG